MKPPNWMRQAACLNEDPDMFFEKPGEEHAKAICRDCPVYIECLEYALAERIEFGVWGGLNPVERRGGGRAKPIVHGTYNGYRTHRRRGEVACNECLEANRQYQWVKKQGYENAPQYTRCVYEYGCNTWAMRGNTLCWTHAGRPKSAV